MEGTYPVNSAGHAVGSVRVQKQGLYYAFHGQCKLTGEVMFRMLMDIGGCVWDLGVLTPESGMFRVNTKLIAKELGQGSPVFTLKPNHKPDLVISAQIAPQEPFAYLSKLQQAYIYREGGSARIGFK